MSYQLRDADHLVIAVADAEAAGAAFERLGFVVTPLSVIANLGVQNRLVLMPPKTKGCANFIEVMSVAPDLAVNPAMQALLAPPEGPRWIVMNSTDARASYAAMTRDGYQFAPVVDVKRKWTLPSGEDLYPEFSVTLPCEKPFRFNFCQYHNVDPYLRDAWFGHENGALCMEDVLYAARDPQAGAQLWAPMFACKPERIAADVWRVSSGGVGVQVIGFDEMAALTGAAAPTKDDVVGAIVKVVDLAALASMLQRRNIAFATRPGRIIVTSHAALLVFTA